LHAYQSRTTSRATDTSELLHNKEPLDEMEASVADDHRQVHRASDDIKTTADRRIHGKLRDPLRVCIWSERFATA
jgi:hypothetical protein